MKKIYLLLSTFLMLAGWSIGQSPQGKSVKPVVAQPGIRKTISQLQSHAALVSRTKPLTLKAAKPMRSYLSRYNNLVRADKKSRTVPALKATNNVARVPSPGSFAQAATPGAGQSIWSNFLGIDFNENPIGWPPDPNGAVSGDQVIVATNNGIKIFDKTSVTDAPLVTPTGYSGERASGIFVPLTDFFSAVLPDGSDISDPHIRYDRLSKRWFIVAIEVNATQENNLILLGVSDAGKVSGTSSFTFYSFQSSLFPYDPDAPYAPFLDYPQLGVDNNSVLIGGNQFGYDSLTMLAM